MLFRNSIMNKIILTLIIGFLQFSPSEVKAQFIEKDSAGIPYACTNYEYHNKQKENKRLVQGFIFIASCVTLLSVERALFPSERNNVDNLTRQMGYAGVAVIGACVTVGLYKWNVKLQNKIGL